MESERKMYSVMPNQGNALSGPPGATSSRRGNKLPSVPLRHPSPPRISHNMGLFGGAVADKTTQNWSRFHIMDHVGRIENKWSHDLTPIGNCSQLRQEDAFEKAGQSGMSTNRIGLRWKLPTGVVPSASSGKDSSGFWLSVSDSEGFFVTSANFLDYTKLDSAQKNEILNQISDIENSDCYVSSRLTTTEIDAEHEDDTRVILWAVNFESDIALFRWTDGLPQHAKQYGVELSRLIAWDPYDPQSPRTAGLPVWSVAYCGRNSDLTTYDGKQFLGKQNAERKQAIREKTGTVFEYMKQSYLQDLKQTPQRPLLHALKSKGLETVAFDDIFKIGSRAIAAGRIASENNKAFVSAVSESQHGQALQHTISTFFGCLGAPVFTWSRSEEPFPVIIGLVSESEDICGKPLILNSFKPFTKSGVQWIEDSMNTPIHMRKLPQIDA